MNRLYILFSCVFLSLTLNSQSLDKLDEKNGFKEFNLGDSYNSWEDQLEYIGIQDEGVKVYKYVGICCQKIFDYPIEEIRLYFKTESLVGIRITTEKFQAPYSLSGQYTQWRTSDFENIKASFSYLFGSPTTTLKDKETMEVTHIWEAEKIMLSSFYEYLGSKAGDRQIVKVFLVDFIEDSIEDGF